MTTAKITSKTGYDCAPHGVAVVHYAFGDVVSGHVAEWAVADGAASRMFDPRTDTQAITPPETKRARKVRK